MAIALGLAFRSRPPDLPRVAVVAEHGSPLVQALLASERLEAGRLERQAAERALSTAKVDLVLEFDGQKPILRFDPAQDRGPAAKLVVNDVLQQAAGRRDPLAISERTVRERGSRYIDFLLPGLIGLNLMGSSMWGVGYNLVVARKRRLLRRYAVTPMRRSHFLLSYFLSRSFFLLLELIVLVGFGALVFDTEVRGSYLSLGIVAYLGSASFAGIGLLIGARVENSEAANGWLNLVQLPMWLLCGAFFSYERFPEWLQAPIRLLPLSALVDGLRAIFNDGASLLACSFQLFVLCVWGIVGFTISLRTFRWQ
jgi:ABC-type multidrug transport system permease subunit